MTVTHSQPKYDRYIPLIVIVIILLASLLRLYNLGVRSFWYDEAASVNDTMSIVEGAPDDQLGPFAFVESERVPPLYFILLVPFYYLSHSEWSLRLASVIFGVITIPLMFLFASRVANEKIGLISALILAFSPFHIYYSQELRPYTLFLLFSLLAYYLTYLALHEHKNLQFIGLVVTFGLGIYTHTYMIFVLFLVDLYFVLDWKTNRPIICKWLLCHLAIGILCIPALAILIYHITRGNTNLVDFPPGLQSIAGTFYLFTMGRFLFPTLPNLILIVPQCIFWGIGIVAGTLALVREKIKKHDHQLLSLFLAGVITYAIIWIISMILVPLFDEARVNYLIFLLPLYFLFVAKGWESLSRPAIKISLVCAVLVISLASSYAYFFEWDQVGKGEFRAAAMYIKDSLEQNEIIYHTNNTSTLPFSYYFNWKVQQATFSISDNSDYINKDHFWLVVFKQIGGAQFGQELFGKLSISPSIQEPSELICITSMQNPNFDLVRSKVFPGKNELTVCLFRRKNS